MKCFPRNPVIRRKRGAPVLWCAAWRGPTFGPDAGDVRDAARRGPSGTRGAGCVWTDGVTGKALSCNGGVGVGASFPRAAVATGRLTVSCWVTPGVTSRGDLVTQWNTGGEPGSQFNLLYGLTAGKPEFYLSSGAAIGSSGVGPVAMAVGRRYRLTGTYDGSVSSVYVDGVLQSSATLGLTLNPSASSAVWVGNNAFGSGSYTGTIEDVRVYDYAFTAARVAADFARPVRRSERPPAYGRPSAPKAPWHLFMNRSV